MKICLVCGVSKPECDYFTRLDTGKLKNECKSCVNIRSRVNKKRRRQENPEKARQQDRNYYSRHSDVVLANKKKNYDAEKISEKNSNGYYANIETRRAESAARQKARRATPEGKEELNKQQRDRHHKKKNTDPLYNILRKYRSRTRNAFRTKGVIKLTSSMEFLGCTADQLKAHIESHFTAGMTWDLVFSADIELDHHIPLYYADCEDEIIELSHYSNLRPMWKTDNGSKLTTLPEEYHIPLLTACLIKVIHG